MPRQKKSSHKLINFYVHSSVGTSKRLLLLYVQLSSEVLLPWPYHWSSAKWAGKKKQTLLQCIVVLEEQRSLDPLLICVQSLSQLLPTAAGEQWRAQGWVCWEWGVCAGKRQLGWESERAKDEARVQGWSHFGPCYPCTFHYKQVLPLSFAPSPLTFSHSQPQ